MVDQEALKNFFLELQALDKLAVFPSSAGIPLSIPLWPVVLRHVGNISEGSDKSSDFSVSPSGLPMLFLIFGNLRTVLLSHIRLIFYTARLFLRKLFVIGPSPIHNTSNVWVTVGSFLQEGEVDKYFGIWPKTTRKPSLRVYQQGGVGIILRRSKDQLPVECLISLFDWYSAVLNHSAALRQCFKLDRTSEFQRVGQELWISDLVLGKVFWLTLQVRAWERILSIYKPKNIVFPYEGRLWERLLVFACKRYGVQTLGYQHTSISDQHLGLFPSKASHSIPWMPHKIICCGDVTAERLRKAHFEYQNRVHVGCALRISPGTSVPMGDKILVALSSSREEASFLLKLVHNAITGGLKNGIIIRPHPSIKVLDIIKKYKWDRNVLFSFDTPVVKDIEASYCVLYNSSTVVLEAMLNGRIPVYGDMKLPISADPIDRQFEGKVVVSNSDELVGFSCTYRELSPEGLASLRKSCEKYASRYLVNPSADILSSMNDFLE